MEQRPQWIITEKYNIETHPGKSTQPWSASSRLRSCVRRVQSRSRHDHIYKPDRRHPFPNLSSHPHHTQQCPRLTHPRLCLTLSRSPNNIPCSKPLRPRTKSQLDSLPLPLVDLSLYPRLGMGRCASTCQSLETGMTRCTGESGFSGLMPCRCHC